MLRRIRAFLWRYLWLFLAGCVLFFTLRKRSGPRLSAELLRRAHEADVDAELAKRRLNEETEQEIRAIRADLAGKLETVELEKLDHRARLASDPGELLRYYRSRGREL